MTSQNHTQAPGLSSCPPNVPSLLLPAFPGAALLVTSADTPGSKLIIKLKREGPLMGGSEELPRTQTFFLTGMPLGWATHCRDGPGGPGIRTVLLTKAGEEPGGRKTRAPEAVPSAQGSPSSDTSFACTSKGVYENYRRWQRYKALARRHFPATPDAEALACFFIPVLRSLARLRPNMTLEDGVPRAVQEWEHSSNFERMIFYEMAEKFMEFEAEEEQQIQKIKLLATCSQFQNPVPKPTKPPMSPAPESGHQQVYIPKKSASKSRQPRRRQKRPPSTSNPGAPREIPAEAVHQYAEIMEGLNTSWEEEEAEKKEHGMCRDTQDQEEGVFPDPGLLQYIDQLCDDEEFVCKVEAVIHPQFMADLLSPEKTQDPLDLVEELAEELNLTPSQLTEKRLLALSEEEREPSVYPTSHSDSTPSQSEEEDEVSGNGKGEDMLRQAVKRSSINKGARASQLELTTSIVSSPLASNSQQKLGDREFLPKTGRASLFPREYCNHGSQEGNLLSTLKNSEERETQKSQEKDLIMSNGNETPTQTQWTFPSVKGNNTLSSHLASPRHSKARPEIVRLVSSGNAKQDISQEQKKKDQEESPKTTEKGSHGIIAPVKNGSQTIWNNVKSTQDGNQQGEMKTIWAAQVSSSKQVEHNKQDNMLLVGNCKGEKHLKLSFSGHRELIEQVINQPQSQEDGGFESPVSKAELDYQERKTRSHPDTQSKVSGQEVFQFERGKQESCQGVVGKDQYQIQGLQKSIVTAVQFENVNPCGRSIASQDRLIPALSGTGHKPVGQGAKTISQRKAYTNVKQMKTMPIKSKSQVRSIRFPVDNLALYKQLSCVTQDGQQSTELAGLETHQETNLKPSVELGRKNMQPLCLGGSSEGGKVEDQLQGGDSEHPPYFIFSEHLPPSLIVQSGLEKLRESQGPFSDQDKVTPQMEKLPNDQCLKPTLNPSSYISRSEADGENSGPQEVHTSVPTSAFPSPLSLQGNSSHGNLDFNPTTLRSESKVYWEPVTPEKETSNWNQLGGDLVKAVTVMNVVLPDLPGGTMEGVPKEDEDEEEDEELSSFSSLLASKLNFSPHSDHLLLTTEQGDTLTFSPMDLAKPVKPRHCSRGQLSQNASPLANKNLDVNSSVHRYHKRKSNTTGTRRSKRLRNQ
ncbi:NUT family member 1 isoform X1 [Crotalus tigris]|uniref:NUT family member 1 isoform X1 n=1 Tax=Crotalus tigris TaxID=88082 RepID=UPI00192F639C|nr:NUT family member 1 isoform X1 [Crotalus tigris]